ncbi:hypothetical protein [Mesorhizobium japonicum]|uniref:Msl9506 protein n=1 Tax=Mesorhizobium japonicum (strain LMG 29417 / CECT 9101 / MAFF 303099) TaxID=266835 RepID=Q98PD5_RHILO|nr:hypothetical protein [Mesorhizobium japonicum]BAB54720.1 msl9506 [Mesorhizobium japonicum MAFF 303099]
MTKISDLGPPIPGKRHGAEPARVEDNFYPCSYCGQLVDQRDLRQVGINRWIPKTARQSLCSRAKIAT